LIFATAAQSNAQEQHEDEIVANLAGAGPSLQWPRTSSSSRPSIVPWREIHSARVVNLDATHIGVLFGASEWRIPADPNPFG